MIMLPFLNVALPPFYALVNAAVAIGFDWYICAKISIILVLLLALRLYLSPASGTVYAHTRKLCRNLVLDNLSLLRGYISQLHPVDYLCNYTHW